MSINVELQHSCFQPLAIELWFDVGDESLKVEASRVRGTLGDEWSVDLCERWDDARGEWVRAIVDAAPYGVAEWIDDNTEWLLAQWRREVA